MPLHNRSRSFILKEHKTPFEKIERYRPTQVESLSVQNVSSSPRELIQLASKPLTLDQERSKHFIESSLDQGNLIYNIAK
jgi:hypothetical protein